MVVTVVNKYKEPNHIYCGRGSPVGNPYGMLGVDTRDLVCDKYEEYFHEMVSEKNSELAKFVNELVLKASLGDINLGCFCAPKRCHCDTIKNHIDRELNK